MVMVEDLSKENISSREKQRIMKQTGCRFSLCLRCFSHVDDILSGILSGLTHVMSAAPVLKHKHTPNGYSHIQEDRAQSQIYVSLFGLDTFFFNRCEKQSLIKYEGIRDQVIIITNFDIQSKNICTSISSQSQIPITDT